MDRRIFLLLLYCSVAACNPCLNRVLNALPYPDACDKYIICWHFFPYVFQCPYDLLFDVDSNNCQVPESARCASTTVTYPTLPTSSTLSISTEFPNTDIASYWTTKVTPASPTKYMTIVPTSPSRLTTIIETSRPTTSDADIQRILPDSMETLLPHFITTETSFTTTISGENQTKTESTFLPSSTTGPVITSTEESEETRTEKSRHLTSVLPISASDTTLSSVTTEEPSTRIPSSTEESSSKQLFSTIESFTTPASSSETELITLSTTELPWTSETEVATEVSTASLVLASETESISDNFTSETKILSTTETTIEITTSIQPSLTTSSSTSVTMEPCQTKECINEGSTKRALIPLPPISGSTKQPTRIILPPIITSPRTTASVLTTSTKTELPASTITLLPSTEQSFSLSTQFVTSSVPTELGATTLTPEFVNTTSTSVIAETILSAEVTSTSNTLTTKVPSQTEFTTSYVTSEPSNITERYTEESSSPLSASTNEVTTVITENITETPSTIITSSGETSISSSTTESSKTGTAELLTVPSTVSLESNYSITEVTVIESTTPLPTLPTLTVNKIPLSPITEETTTAELITSTPSPSELTTNFTEFLSSTNAELPTLGPLQSTIRPFLPPFTLSTMSSVPTSTTAVPFTSRTIPPCLQTTILIPDPLDCKYFFYCNSGFWYHYSCRYGREFSPKKLKCMRPWEAQCRARYFEDIY